MAYLTTFYWGWLLASVLLGFAMGWISVVQHGEGVPRKLRWGLSALVAALVAAALARVVPGRFGYWLDLGLIMFALYLGGCTVGSLLRGWVVSRSSPPA
jgi:hypothetical protein